MKLKKIVWVFLLITTVNFFTGCSSDDDNSANEEMNCSNSGDILAATIDGKAYCAIGVMVIPTGFEIFDQPSYMIQGISQDQKILIVSINNEEGTYSIPQQTSGGYTPDAVREINYITHEENPASGTVTIEEITSERARGSFEFTAYRLDPATGDIVQESVTVTGGRFNVALPSAD